MHLRRYLWLLAGVWTATVAASLVWNLHHQNEETLAMARSEARIAYNKDLVYRRWAASHGGVYVPVTDQTPPNPYLEVPEREITTPSGRLLTLVNPAYMTRQVHELGEEQYGARGHITSLRPIRPANAPDPWETEALKAFERGETQASSVEEIEGEPYMRLMHPLITEEGCLKCHAAQGYQLGDIRGGISVSVPMAPLWAISRQHALAVSAGHSLLWLLGLAGLGLGARHLGQRVRERDRAQEALREARDTLEMHVRERTAELEDANEHLQREIVERKRAEQAIRESDLWMRGIFNSLEEAVFVVTADRRLVNVNAAAEGIFGYSKDELVNRSTEILHVNHEHYVEFGRRIRQAFDHEDTANFEFAAKRKNGEVFPTEHVVSLLKNDAGDALGIVSVVRDITERKQAEEELEEHRVFQEAVLECIADGIVACDQEGTLVYFNRATREFHGLPVEPIPSEEWATHYHLYEADGKTPLTQERIPLFRTLRGEDVSDQEMVIAPKGLPPRTLVAAGRMLTDSKGNPLGAVVLMNDITERRRAEEALRQAHDELEIRVEKRTKQLAQANEELQVEVTERDRAEEAMRESEAQVRLLLNSTGEAIYGLDLQGNCTFCNPSCLRLLGYQDERELLGKNMHGLMHHTRPDGTHYAAEECRACQGEGAHVDDEFLWRADGSSFPAEYWSYPIRQGNEVVGLVVTFLDITERKEVEEENRRLALAVNSAAEAVVLTDKQGHIIQVNPAFTRISGYTPEEAIGQTPRVLKSGKHPPDFYEAMWKTITTGEVWFGRVVNKRKDGSFYHAALTIAPVRDDSGEVTGYVGVQRDVTEDIEREEALADALHRAQDANRAKSDFLANMSHEIRTPMTSIIGFAEKLLDRELSESDRLNAVHTVRRNGQHLLEIINDILDLSKIEAGKMEVEHIKCSPCEIVAAAASLVGARAAAGGLSLDVEYPGPIPETIHGDPTRLRQILINLLSNAIKFTKTGGVRLVTRFVKPDGERGGTQDDPQSAIANPQSPMLQFDVIDTGVGMTPQQTARLFQPFQQADSSMARSFGGTGLGLTISKRFARMLGGDVVLVKTQPDRGSRFRLFLPTGPLDGVTMLQPPSEANFDKGGTGAGADGEDRLYCRILLAEDGPDNQRLISFILTKAGADVTVAADGQEAVDKAMGALLRRRGRDVDQPFDVILMDMQMPVMDGYTATRTLRRKGYTGAIIALTAHAMAGERQKCLDAGCDDYATKPIDRQELIDTIRAYTSSPPSPAGEGKDELCPTSL